MATDQRPPWASDPERFGKSLTPVVWALLFVWAGVAALAQVGWGFGMLGAGIIILAAPVRHLMLGRQHVDVFSVVVGLLFLFGGVWELFTTQVALIPVLCFWAGVVLLASALRSAQSS